QPTTLSSDQATTLKTQNDQRLTKELKSLIWDDNLAADAQQWANHLASIDSLMHSTSDQRANQGENLAYSFNSDGVLYPLTQGAQGWVAEVSNYNNEIIPQGNFAAYGHYTQVMWSSTNKIGMANATAANGGVYIVARYSPPGNYLGQR
ncbi:CAP domain-containing protein, partial [Truncatella angustata]